MSPDRYAGARRSKSRDVAFLRRKHLPPIKITLPGPFTMAQQAQDDYYKDEEALAMALAAAVNEEIRDLKAAGADVVQIDEPWLQARPERAERYGVKAINRALQGIGGTTVVHLCFGYAAAVKDKPTGYSFLPQLADTSASQISIEAAQPRLDLSVLKTLEKTLMVGVIDLGSENQSSRPGGRRPHPRRAQARSRRAPGGGARLRHEIPDARSGVRQAQGARRRRRDREERAVALAARLRPGAVALLLEVLVLRALLRIDLALHRVRACLLLGRARRADVGRRGRRGG